MKALLNTASTLLSHQALKLRSALLIQLQVIKVFEFRTFYAALLYTIIILMNSSSMRLTINDIDFVNAEIPLGIGMDGFRRLVLETLELPTSSSFEMFDA